MPQGKDGKRLRLFGSVDDCISLANRSTFVTSFFLVALAGVATRGR